jgi:predicted RNase H-like HicB family nuclease
MSKATLAYTCWQDENMWLGYLDEYPDYMTQGETYEELKENLKDVYKELISGHIPAVRHHDELNLL